MNQHKKIVAWIPIAIAISIVIGMWIGNYYGVSRPNSKAEEKFRSVMDLISREYVDTVDLNNVLDMAIPKLLSNLDPHSTYIPAKDLTAVNDELEGSFSGIGIQFNTLTDTINVVEVISGGPSEKVGIMAGDRIIEINDSIVAGTEISNQDIISKLRGPKGSKVKLGIKRSTSKEILDFEVTRGDIPVTSIDASYMITPEIGFIKVNKFGRTTYSEFLTSLVDLRSKGATKYIIDLRGNGGGYMEMAILMANEFLSANSPIVFTKGRSHNKSDNSSTFSDGLGSFSDSQLVVLIDEYSASASEIFAGAMQDNDRALVMGRRSYGKGLVQRQSLLPDSSAIRLTVARYYTPSGRCIQKDYTPGKTNNYSLEILDRYNHGEAYNADSIKFNKDLQYSTNNGRIVYGGGGIMPDIFIPNDTTGVTGYYINVLNAGLPHSFAFKYCDLNRNELNKAKSTSELLKLLPNDDVLLQSFVRYATQKGVPARWYYINISRSLIINLLKALISQDILGKGAFYEIINQQDRNVNRAIAELEAGNAIPPITIQGKAE